MEGETFLRPDWSDAAAGVYAICCGTIKKVLLADGFGAVVGNGWSRLGDLSAPAAWLVILATRCSCISISPATATLPPVPPGSWGCGCR